MNTTDGTAESGPEAAAADRPAGPGAPVPVPDTADLRSGAPIHESLLSVLPLVGIWEGRGAGVVDSSGVQFAFGQRVEIVHDGRPFLAYSSRSWLVDAAGALLRPAWRESGFWRVGSGPDDVELVVASNTGQAITFAGTAGDLRWELASLTVAHTPAARAVDGERRLYALRGDELVYATELAPAGHPFAPHLNARLSRH